MQGQEAGVDLAGSQAQIEVVVRRQDAGPVAEASQGPDQVGRAAQVGVGLDLAVSP
jgi:hypothetical protein